MAPRVETNRANDANQCYERNGAHFCDVHVEVPSLDMDRRVRGHAPNVQEDDYIHLDGLTEEAEDAEKPVYTPARSNVTVQLSLHAHGDDLRVKQVGRAYCQMRFENSWLLCTPKMGHLDCARAKD